MSTRRSGARIALLIAAATIAAPAWADEATVAPPSHMVPLTDAQMADARGGFDWGGMSIAFGADMQTYLNGQLAMRTIVQWSASGAMTQTMIGSGITPASIAQMQGMINVPSTLGGNPVYFANAGQTALVQGAEGGLQNILLNSANGLNAIQQTNATLSLSNYGAFASSLQNQAIGAALGAEVARLGR